MDLSKVKLKKTVTKDSSAPVLTEGVKPLETKSYENTILDFNIENWLELIEKATFPTKFLPISVDDARLFMEAHKTTVMDGKQLSKAQIARFAEIEAKLAEVIRTVQADSDGVFVKSSSRSAKNSSTGTAALVESYKQYLAEFDREAKETKQPISVNQKIMSLLRAGTDQMKVKSAEEAVSLFIKSERIYHDFEIALKHPERFVENFVVRKWVPLEVTLEFRAFVVGGRLTAISSYSNMIFVPVAHAKKREIQEALFAFFDKNVKEQLAPKEVDGKMRGFPQYVVDFAFARGAPLTSASVFVIEVNPFLPTTDSGLFDWAKDAELLHGKRPFEFRIRDEPPLGALALLLPDWRKVIDDVDSERSSSREEKR